jgi:hypothetical protein
LIESDSTEPVATEPSAQDAAGFANSAVECGPNFPWRRAIVVVLVIGASIASPGIGSFTVLFAVAVMALGLLRGAGRLFTAVCVAGSAVVAGAVAANADLDERWIAAAVVSAVLAALLAIEHRRSAQPDPGEIEPLRRVREPREQTLAEQMAASSAASSATTVVDASAWPEPRVDRGVSYVTYAWLVATMVLVAVIGITVGEHRMSSSLQSAVRSSFTSYDSACADGGKLENDTTTCKQILDARDYALDAARDHAPTVLTLFASLALTSCAWLAHLIVVARARVLAAQRWRIDTRPSYRLRELEFHWSWAYVGVLGVLGLILARPLSGATQEWTFAAAAGVTSVAGQVIAMQGTAVAAWVFSRRPMPWWYRIVLIITVLFAWPFVIGVLLLAGAIDMWISPRRRATAPAATPA